MKRYIVPYLFFFFFSQVVLGQFMDNKVDIGISAVAEIPFGIKDEGGFPTLFANYYTGYGYKIHINKKIIQELKVGLDFYHSSFTRNDADGFPSISIPNSYFDNLLASIGYSLGSRFKYGGNISFGAAFHKLKIGELIIPADPQVINRDLEYREMEFVVSTGINLSYHLTSELKSTLTLNYKYMTAGNLLYQDVSFQSMILSVGVSKKLLKDKYFQYE